MAVCDPPTDMTVQIVMPMKINALESQAHAAVAFVLSGRDTQHTIRLCCTLSFTGA